MANNNNKKICIVVSSLGQGGVERSSATLSKMLHDLGYEVYVVSVLNQIDFDYAGKLLNLGIYKEEMDSLIGRYHRFMMFKKFIINQKFDLIIDSRTKPNPLKEFFIHRFLYKNQNLVHIVHSSKLNTYLPESKWVFNLVYKSVKTFVCVSAEITNQIQKQYDVSRINTIYNTVNLLENEKKSELDIEMDFEYILYYGRLEDKVKNISLLIDAYKISKLRSKGLKLLILGNGSDKSKLVKKVESFALQDSIIFLPFVKNPFGYVKKAKFTVLTSRYEGLPMAVIESLSLGIPVISVDCQGSIEIIRHGFNGLMVENFNSEALAKAMNSFIFDKKLYRSCKSNTKKSIERFSHENISADWKAFINEII